MTEALQTAIGTIAAVFVSRLWSNWEHRKSRAENKETSAQVNNIYMMVNGEMKKKLEEEYERGKADGKGEIL